MWAPAHVNVENFSTVQDDFPTRGTPVGDYTGVKVLTLAFYASDGTELYKHSQLRNDPSTYETFGEFDCSLPMGTHTMVVIGYGGTTPFNLTSPVSAQFVGERLQDTFVATQSVTITDNNGVNVSATLNRVVSMLGVCSSDFRVEEATKIRMSLTAGGRDFNPTTGLAIVNTGFVNTLTFVEAVGATTSSATFLFLTEDEQTMDVTIETLDADDNVLFSETVNDVPFQRNRRTILTGKLFSDGISAGSFQIEQGWISPHNMGF
jgi:hypothetical protein